MSNPGNPITPQMRQMQLAQMLQGGMDNQAQAPMNTPYAGMANAGNSILSAALMKNMQNEADPQNVVMQQRYGISPQDATAMLHPGIMSKIGGLFGMGGGAK